MRLFIRSRGMVLTNQIRKYVERRFHSAADRFQDQLGDVTVVVRDVNGPRGGVDKECVIHVNSPSVGRLTVAERRKGVMPAIFGAVQRFSFAVKKRMRFGGDNSLGRRAREWLPVREP